ncbi:MAG: MFS transporter, partial [Nitrospira sp.]|nr:MFS transporter [Nitrospira sp.]MBA3752978.1 MFS transporter [Nitrospira sp.]
FGTVKHFLDALYQYPGGWLSDHLGRRAALLVFLALASLGYVIYLLSASWPFLFLGLVFVMAWDSMASSAIFAVIGDALPQNRLAIGFTVQSILRRVPMAVAPLLGGVAIDHFGITSGVHGGLLVTLVLAGLSGWFLRLIDLPLIPGSSLNVRGVWQSLHRGLKRLLISDILIRAGQGLVDVLIVLYVTNVLGLSITLYAVLVAIQLTTSILVYLPAAKLADRMGRKPFVIATFVCFSLFPLAVALASGFLSLIAAFIIGGLREIGEPARKAMIVDFAAPHIRGRTVGLYYLLRSLSVAPAGVVGGLLWTVTPDVPFVVGSVVGLMGTIVFALTVQEQYAS